MQDLLTFAIDSIALSAAFYFTVGLILHLHHCWQHPPVKAAPIAAEFDLMEIIDPAGLLTESPLLLLLPAASVEPMHPFEMSLQKMPAIETIAAVHQPAAAVEPIAESLDVEELLEAIDIPAPNHYAQMTIRELKRIASDRKISGYSKRTKSELIELLTV